MTQDLGQKKNYHNYRVGGKFAKRPENQPKVISVPKNHLVLVVDESGSMQGLNAKVVEFVNKWITDNKANSAKFGQQTYISLICYNNSVRHILTNVRIDNVKTFTSYYPSGSTALFQAQEQAILDLELIISNSNTSFLINHITDGDENQSWGGPFSYRGGYEFGYDQRIKNVVNKMIEKQKLGNWTFTFLLPPGRKTAFVSKYGLEAGNIKEWDTTEQGLYDASVETTSGLYNYYETRSTGGQSVKNFYDVKVDLSKISNLAKQSGLTDLSNKYLKVKVERECDSKTLCLEENIIYRPGILFYELTKPEKVQPNKEVLVVEKGKNNIYGGKEARHLIGLPDNQYAKVDPFNLSRYKVYIQSNAGSGNRILVRGTYVLIKK